MTPAEEPFPGRRSLPKRLLRPIVGPPLRAALWVASRGYLSAFKRDHRWLMRPQERPLLHLREQAKDGDVWVLSNQAVYFGLKAADRRLSRTPRADILSASHAAMGGLHVVTLTIDEEQGPPRVVTGCFSATVHQRQVRKLMKELSPSAP